MPGKLLILFAIVCFLHLLYSQNSISVTGFSTALLYLINQKTSLHETLASLLDKPLLIIKPFIL
jgi:hypothetical protein